jgi:selenocysteine lyase/cysteine desulfurase
MRRWRRLNECRQVLLGQTRNRRSMSSTCAATSDLARGERAPAQLLDNGAEPAPTSVIDAISNRYETTHANVHRGVHVLSQGDGAELNRRATVHGVINAARHVRSYCARNDRGDQSNA